MSQIRVNTPSKLSASPNLPTFLGQELVPNTKGLFDQWLFQVEDALATHHTQRKQSDQQRVLSLNI